MSHIHTTSSTQQIINELPHHKLEPASEDWHGWDYLLIKIGWKSGPSARRTKRDLANAYTAPNPDKCLTDLLIEGLATYQQEVSVHPPGLLTVLTPHKQTHASQVILNAEVYEGPTVVEHILSHDDADPNDIKYLVHFEGYLDEDDEWYSEADILNDPSCMRGREALQAYWARQRTQYVLCNPSHFYYDMYFWSLLIFRNVFIARPDMTDVPHRHRGIPARRCRAQPQWRRRTHCSHGNAWWQCPPRARAMVYDDVSPPLLQLPNVCSD